MRDLSKAIFVLLADDVEAVKEHHRTGQGRHTLTPEELEAKGAKYWAARCRRMVRAAEELKQALAALMDKYKDARDPERGNQLLFTEYTQQVYAAVLELIDSGSFCGEKNAWHRSPAGWDSSRGCTHEGGVGRYAEAADHRWRD